MNAESEATDSRLARVMALCASDRDSLLAFLCGYSPQGIDSWLRDHAAFTAAPREGAPN